jgi:hypothetical protein
MTRRKDDLKAHPSKPFPSKHFVTRRIEMKRFSTTVLALALIASVSSTALGGHIAGGRAAGNIAGGRAAGNIAGGRTATVSNPSGTPYIVNEVIIKVDDSGLSGSFATLFRMLLETGILF